MKPDGPHLEQDDSESTPRDIQPCSREAFQFGSRFLSPGDDVYQFNAWDHVEPDSDFLDFANRQYDMQRANPVPDREKARFDDLSADKWWNKFYVHNTSNFFKDRRWLFQEFPLLTELTAKDAGSRTIVEIGAGAGNTVFPILLQNSNPELIVHALDFSKAAIDLIRQNEGYHGSIVRANVWNLASPAMPEGVEPGTIDAVLMIFVFSALSPEQWPEAIQNVSKMLKPGGKLLLRDYGRNDLTQVRFKKGRLLKENFYIRGDGTRVYYFEKEELVEIWTQTVSSLALEKIEVDRRMLVNRKEQVKMYRNWIQAVFVK